jgi:hypothetical protein
MRAKGEFDEGKVVDAVLFEATGDGPDVLELAEEAARCILAGARRPPNQSPHQTPSGRAAERDSADKGCEPSLAGLLLDARRMRIARPLTL